MTLPVPAGIEGAIFDLDGTLLDSVWIWEEIDRAFFSARGMTVPPDYMRAVSLMQYRQTAEYTIKRFGLNEQPEALMAEWTRGALEAYRTRLELKPFVKQYLKQLSALGIKLAVATSATPEMCLPALERNGVLDMFSAVIATMEIGKGKEHPDVYLAAADALGLKPNACAVYEDTLDALQTAKAAGFFPVAVYDGYSARDAEKLRQTASLSIDFENPRHRPD